MTDPALAESSPVFDERRRPMVGAPNVVMVVLDDLGFADLGCFGSGAVTPNVDGLAERGLRYNNFHVTAICSASRACLLTGRNHHAVGMGFLTHFSLGFPGYTARIPRSAGTLPRHLRDAGYSTFAVGKWHLTPSGETGPAGPFDRWPLGMGFERYYGFLGGATNQWTPDLVCDNGFVEQPSAPEEGYHVTEDLAARAIRFVQDQQQATPEKPFFLYFAPGAMHSPHQVPGTWVEQYAGRFDAGWEAWRQETFQRQLELGVVPPGTALTERTSWVQSWETLSSGERRLYARMMEVYAGFLTHTDAQIGRLVDFFATIGVLDNTIIMVLSDNGASADGGPHGILDAAADDVETMLDRIDDFGGFHGFNHYAWGWAWAGNTPFRLWKKYTWLGGVRVPLVVHWPAGIADSGGLRTQFCHAVDLMPTILDASSVAQPGTLDGVSQLPLDGASLAGTFANSDHPSPRNTQYFEMMGSRAIYHDGWKATTDHVNGHPLHQQLIEGSHEFDSDRWALFHVTEDFAEAHDLADTHPDKLRHLIELWWHEAGRNHVLPLMDDIELRGHIDEPWPALEPPLNPPRHEYVCRPGGAPVDIPSPFAAGFTLTADIELSDHHGAGTICRQWSCAYGITLPGGWACYVLDGHPVVTVNVDDTPCRIVAPEPIQAGRHTLSVHYTPDGPDNHGQVTMGVDDRPTVTGRIGRRGSDLRRNTTTKMLVGRDQGFPICDDYAPPFPFTGRIRQVVFRLPIRPQPPGLREQIAGVLEHD